MEAPELLAAAAGPSTGEKGAEQFGSQEQPFKWDDEQIWPELTATERAAVVELLEEYRGVFAWSIMTCATRRSRGWSSRLTSLTTR
jgi:hypothetical protein